LEDGSRLIRFTCGGPALTEEIVVVMEGADGRRELEEDEDMS
jgi:hypothetical protein